MAIQRVGNNLMVDFDGARLTVYPPKMRTLKNMSNMLVDEDKAMDSAVTCVSEILSNNSDGEKITPDQILDVMNIVEVAEIMNEVANWTDVIKKK